MAIPLLQSAVWYGDIPALWVELELAGPESKPPKHIKFDKDLLEGFIAARSLAAGEMAGNPVKTAKNIRSSLDKTKTACKMLDSTFDVVVLYFNQMAEEAGFAKAEEKVLRQFLQYYVKKPKTLKMISEMLQQIMTTPLWKSVGEEQQSTLKTGIPHPTPSFSETLPPF